MSGILDDASALARYDPGGMLPAIGRWPEQLREGWRLSRALQLPDRHLSATSVAVLGMGGSAIAGDLVRGTFSDALRLPLVTVRDYELPAFVGRQTLVVACSFSGATEETVSSLAAALERRCPVVVVATGGPLHDVAVRAELPLLAFPREGQPRAAVGYMLALVAGLLERAGALDLDDAAIAGTAETAEKALAEWGPDAPTERNLAKELAWTLLDRLPVVEASGFLAPVARRWKTQLNENGKTTAAWEELPEATHNTVVGYEHPESVRDHLFVVFLASPGDHPRNSLRASLSAELLAEARIGHQVVAVPGEDRLAQTCSAVVLGDLVSTYLGVLYRRDPTPVEPIARIKERLLAAGESAED